MSTKHRFHAFVVIMDQVIENQDKAALERVTKALDDITPEELHLMQNKQAMQFACGVLSLDEATWLYERLGKEAPSPERFKALPLAEKLSIVTWATCKDPIHKHS